MNQTNIFLIGKIGLVSKYLKKNIKFKKIYSLRNFKKELFNCIDGIQKYRIEKSNKYLNWKPIWNLDDALNKIIEWDMLNKNGIHPKEICENQILSYFNT